MLQKVAFSGVKVVFSSDTCGWEAKRIKDFCFLKQKLIRVHEYICVDEAVGISGHVVSGLQIRAAGESL